MNKTEQTEDLSFEDYMYFVKMASVTWIVMLCVLFLVKGIKMITLRRVEERMNQIELRLISESKYRNEDVSMLLSRLDNIDAKLNKLMEGGKSTKKENIKHETEYEQSGASVDDIKSQFLQLIKAFQNEKRMNTRTRRQVYVQQIRINQLNKMPTFMEALFKQTENSMNEIRNDIKQVHGNISESIKSTENVMLQVFKQSDDSDYHYDNVNVVQTELTHALDDIRVDISEAKTGIHNITQSMDRHMAVMYYVLSASVSNDIFALETSRQTLFRYARSCSDLKQSYINVSSVYDIYRSGKRIKVFCDQQTDGGGWTVFQRRQDGSENFNRNWLDYKEGFGSLQGEFWLGNEYLHLLTNEDVKSCELRVDMTAFENDNAYAKYASFKVGSESDKYKLEVSGYTGTAGDALKVHNGMYFSTHDKPGTTRCARDYQAGWHNKCYNANPNGVYYKEAGVETPGGIYWLMWEDHAYSLKHIEMKVRCKPSLK